MTEKPAILSALALAALAASCSSEVMQEHAVSVAVDARAAAGTAYSAARRAMAPPALAPVESPAPLTGAQTVSMPTPPPQAAYAPQPNSLWRPGARSFFNDQRASRVGDILTVRISIADSAQLSNSSDRQRTASTQAGVTNFLGLENIPGRVLPGGFDPGALFAGDSTSSASGQGNINRAETVDLTVAAVIVDVLANGNLVIAGRQDVRINAEMRELTVSGVIRPEDINPSNTVSHTQIAEARISYGGRGQLSAVQRPGLGQRVADALSPW